MVHFARQLLTSLHTPVHVQVVIVHILELSLSFEHLCDGCISTSHFHHHILLLAGKFLQMSSKKSKINIFLSINYHQIKNES